MSGAGQIIAMGGGGFSMESTPLLDEYVLAASGKRRPRVCFVPTASGDAALYVERFHAAFADLPCEPAHLSLFQPPPGSLADFVAGQDVFYVGGGSTRNLLVLWREWGLDALLRAAWERGAVLAGISAGAICWFEEGLSDSVATGELHPLPCLGFLPGSCCPHYDGEADRRPRLRELVGGGLMRPGYAADDGAALHFVGGELTRVVASRPRARAYRLERDARGGALETPLPTEYLGERGGSRRGV